MAYLKVILSKKRLLFQYFKLLTQSQLFLPLGNNNITPDCSNRQRTAESSLTRHMIDENPSTVIVNIHGLLGEQEVIQMEFDAELLVEEEQFEFDNVSYEIVRIINEDVEYPVVYVVILDILSQS